MSAEAQRLARASIGLEQAEERARKRAEFSWPNLLREAERAFLPHPERSDREAQRMAHEDLATLPPQGLWREIERARFLMIWLDNPHEWITQRMVACIAEQNRRGKNGR